MVLFGLLGCEGHESVEQPMVSVVTRVEEFGATECLEKGPDYIFCQEVVPDASNTKEVTVQTQATLKSTSKVLLLESDTLSVSDSLVLNGAHMGQGLSKVAGVDAWLQQSDWNQLYVSIPNRQTLDTTVQIDMYIPSGSRASICPFGTKVGYNTLTQAFCLSVTDSDIVLSNANQETQTLTLPSAVFDQWNTWKIYTDESKKLVSVTVEGDALSRRWHAVIGVTRASTEYVVLTSGHSPAWTSSNVAFAHLRVEGRQ